MPLLPDADPLLALAIILVAGVFTGWVAIRGRLPSITGQILVGVLLGPVFHVFAQSSIDGLQPITHFALGLMSVTVGAHLNLKRMRNAGKRLAFLVGAEVLLLPTLVVGATVFMPGIEWSTALIFGAIAIATAPATVVALVKETRSKGVFVKTLMGAVALNNVACILLFETARSVARLDAPGVANPDLTEMLLTPATQLFLALVIGGLAAFAMQVVDRYVVRPEVLSTAGLLAILLTLGIAEHNGVSGVLSCLFLGIVQTNLTPAREKLVDSLFKEFEPAILAIFFTLAGLNLHFDQMRVAGLVALAYFFARAAGKLLAANLAMRLAGATQRVRRFLGFCLIPQAGLAIGLVFLIKDDPLFAGRSETVDLILAVVLTVVALNEIIGPLATRMALIKAGEAGMDRTRLLDFIQEENIVTELQAGTKEHAIEQLVDHMIRSHHLDIDRETLLGSVLEREAQASTCLGGGLAIPHATLPEGHPMVGVMGLSSSGLGFNTPDDKPVHCVALFGTSPGERDRHLQVLATLARTIGLDPAFQDRLFNATTPAHASEILHGEESHGFNYFLDDEE